MNPSGSDVAFAVVYMNLNEAIDTGTVDIDTLRFIHTKRNQMLKRIFLLDLCHSLM